MNLVPATHSTRAGPSATAPGLADDTSARTFDDARRQQDYRPARRAAAQWVVVAALVLAGCWPLLKPFFDDLGTRPPYALYPLLLAAAATLAVSRLRDLPARGVRTGSTSIAAMLFAISLLLLVGGAAVDGRWLAAPATLLALAGLLWRIGGVSLFRALLPAGFLLLTIVPPPLRGETKLTVALQHLSVDTSSRLLDIFAIPNVCTGNVLNLADHRLLIQEACSGINSIIAVVAFTLLLGFWRRRGPLWIVALLPSALLFVVCLNIARITGGALLLSGVNLDLFDGGIHEWIGLALFAAGIGLILSVDAGFEWIAQSRPMSADVAPPSPVIRPPLIDRMAPGAFGWTVATCFAIVGLGSAWQLRDCWPAPRLSADALLHPPETVGDWTLVSITDEAAVVATTTARHARHWTYRNGSQTVEVAIAYPFTTWFHDPSICYAQAGWDIVRRGAIDAPSPNASATDVNTPAASFGFDLSQTAGRFATVLYADFSERGDWQRPLAEPTGNDLRRRIEFTRRAAHYAPSCEVQTLAVTNAPLTLADRQRLTTLFAGRTR